MKISKGPEIVKMIKVVGMKYEDAERQLKDDLHLNVEKIEETSKTVEKEYVIKQEIEEGKDIKVGETVKLYVSIGTGLKEIAMPYVIGDTEEEAKKKLEGLTVTVVYEEDMSKTDGRVLKQSIEAGTTIEEKTKVTITVNKIEEIKIGVVKLNLKSFLGSESEIKLDENGQEIDPTVNVKITVNDEPIYNDTNRKDETNIEAEVSGKGTVTVKVWINDIKKTTKQFNLSTENPVLTID